MNIKKDISCLKLCSNSLLNISNRSYNKNMGFLVFFLSTIMSHIRGMCNTTACLALIHSL